MTLKRKTLHAGFLGIALGLLTAGSLAAQDECPAEGSWGDCLRDRLNQLETLKGVIAKVKKEAEVSGEKEEATAEAGELIPQILIGTATGSEINLEDFLSSLLATLDIDGLEDSGGGLRFKKNFQLTYGTLAVELLAKKGELFPELEMKLEGAEQKDLIEDLEDELEDFDDLNLNLTFSVDRSGDDKAVWWGRRYRSANGLPTGNALVADTLFDQIIAYLGEKVEALNQMTTEENFIKMFRDFNEDVGEHTATLVGKTSDEDKPGIYAKLNEVAKVEKVDFKNFEGALKTFRYSEVSKLVANQPQFVLSAGRSFRDELVGRNSWTASVKYEMGQANVNGLRRECPNLSITCYTGFLKDKDGALKKNWRLAVNGSYTWTEDYDYASPDGAVSLKLDESEAWDVSLSAGRTLRLTDKGQELTRFELEAVFQDVTGDTEKQARFVSNATFTQKISDTVSMAIGLVYANRPEYRGEVDEELSARAGLKINLSKKKAND